LRSKRTTGIAAQHLSSLLPLLPYVISGPALQAAAGKGR
jgi:hypothetical protein